jgi:hypothetical protein
VRLAVPIVLLAGAVLTGCRAARVDVPADITTSSDREWLVPAESLEAQARTRAQPHPVPTTDAAPRPAVVLPEPGAAYRFTRRNIMKDLLETPTGRYLAEVARHQLGAELDPSNPLPNQRVILMPAYNGDQLSVVLRVYW